MTHNYSSGHRKSRYSEHYKIYGDSPKSMQWQNYHAAARRYRELAQSLHFQGKSILDAGCGMGDFLPYIYSQTQDFDYLGMDVTPDFVETAKKRYEGHAFQTGDPFNDSLPDCSFDIVVSSGVMNAYAPDWLEQRKRMITRLFHLANEAVAFNMAGNFNPPQPRPDSSVAYAYIPDIMAFCQDLTPKLSIRTHYHPRDFTITLFK